MSTLNITYTILAGNCGDLSRANVEIYADNLLDAIAAEYPDADIDVSIKWNTSGIGGGASVREVDEGYEINPDEAEFNTSEIETTIEYIAERVFETA